jgi:hypothetical protein
MLEGVKEREQVVEMLENDSKYFRMTAVEV